MESNRTGNLVFKRNVSQGEVFLKRHFQELEKVTSRVMRGDVVFPFRELTYLIPKVMMMCPFPRVGPCSLDCKQDHRKFSDFHHLIGPEREDRVDWR